MLNHVAIFLGAIVMGTPAIAQTASAPPPAPTPGASGLPRIKDPNRIICEKQEEIGSRLGGKKVCHTALEWADLKHENREEVDDWQQRNTLNPRSN